MQRIITVIVFAIVYSSCANKSQSYLAVLKASEVGLNQSIATISASNKIIYNAIEDRAKNPVTAQFAAAWQPKAMLIKDICLSTINYIETLVKELKEAAGLKMENTREVYREDDKDAVSDLFISKGKGIELQEKLQKFKQDMIAVDSQSLFQFDITMINVADSNFKGSFVKTFFENTSTIAALVLLRRFESAVCNDENNFITFCLNKSASFVHIRDYIAPIISLNSNTVRAGEDITITAGVGMFSTVMQPIITIGKTTLQPGDQGVVTYEFKAIGKAGKYIIPVKIEYVKPDKEKETITQKVEYTIVE